MPIYRGDNLISDVKLGGQNIANVYHGDVAVFSRNLLSYRVRITGDGYVNSYDTAGSEYQNGYGISSYFSVDNTSNTGATGYGVLLNTTAFNQMISIASGSVGTSTYSCSITKESGYNFISLFIGFNVFDIDGNAFTIAPTFYALNAAEGPSNVPADYNNTHVWKFISDGNNFTMSYGLMSADDFTAVSQIMQSGAVITQFTLMPLGKRMSGFFEAIGPAWLVASKAVTFNETYGIPTMEIVTNNGVKVTSNLIQSLTNNFNFAVKSLILGCIQEIITLNGHVTMTGTGQYLQIINYTPPQENVPGILQTALTELTLGE